MKLLVKIVAISEEHGLKATREEVVEISPKVRKLTEAVMGDDAVELLNSFATTAAIAALQTVQMGGMQSRMEAQSNASGPIGGRPQVQEDGRPAPPRVDPLSKALGLDAGLEIIEAMDAKERGHAPPMRGGGHVRGGGGGGGGLPLSPGPVGFGPDRNR